MVIYIKKINNGFLYDYGYIKYYSILKYYRYYSGKFNRELISDKDYIKITEDEYNEIIIKNKI